MSVENTSTKAQLGSSSADIVERLREFAAYGGDAKARILAQLALTEIERLRGGAARAPAHDGATHMRRPEYLTAWAFDGSVMPIWLIKHFKSMPLPEIRRGHYATAIDGEFWRWFEPEKFHEMFVRIPDVAQSKQERSDLTKLAAECHRAKWEFDLSEDFQPSKSAARALITNAFNALHRIGDMALKLRDAASSMSSTENTAPMTSQQGNTP